MSDVLSPCCSAPIDVRRQVHDTVVYDPTWLEDGNVLHVSYVRVYEGDADAFEVTCTACGSTLTYEIEED